jgi:hypothetical protein
MSAATLELLGKAESLHALTLWQPWAWAIATPEAGKDVENRSWPPPKPRLGQLLAIHAGATYDADAAEGLREEFRLDVPAKRACTMSAVVAVAQLVRAVRNSPSRWAMAGNWHWCLEGAVALPTPVPCKGAQGLWQLPAGVFSQVRAQLLGAEGGSGRGCRPAGEEAAKAAPGFCSCGAPMVQCRACTTWWCERPGHLRHRCEAGWPRCAHGQPCWEGSTGKPIAPDCCRPSGWWLEGAAP